MIIGVKSLRKRVGMDFSRKVGLGTQGIRLL